MGSGLILLVIVAAWLAVLVPMALRSHEATTSLASVDRFSDAMRVLSRRDAAARSRSSRADRYGLGDDDLGDDDLDVDDLHGDALDIDDLLGDEWDDDDWDGRDGLITRAWGRVATGSRTVVARLGGRRSAHPTGPAVRRRRLLVTLVALALAALVGGLVGPRVLLAVHGALVVLVALYVVQLRRLAVQRATLSRRAERTAPAPVAEPRSRSVRVAPSIAPATAATAVEQPLFDQTADDGQAVEHGQIAARVAVSTAARYDDPLPVSPAAALGRSWDPVPVPVPTYVTAAVAPPRAQRMVDLTRPGDWSAPPIEAERAVGADERLGDDAVERRRAVNDW